MLQTTIIGGLGLAVFATSGFTPTQQFGYLMISTLLVALVGDLVLLPALLAGPLGYYFGGKLPVADTAALATPGAFAEATKRVLRKLQLVDDQPEVHLPKATETLSPHFPLPSSGQPIPVVTPAHAAAPVEDRKNLIDGPHADLHTRLRNLRRDSSQGRLPS
jgi:hypothetical protein